jgi:D-psicose/D-tagatose/L-ribulose 3-epimerase
MRLSISNIAWEPAVDEAVCTLLQQQGVEAIDVAPTKYFPDLKTASVTAIDAVRSWWADRGIGIAGVQSLLFGTQGLNVFGDAQVQAAMLNHLDSVCHVAARLQAPRMVFGSPRNRDRSGLDDSHTLELAASFFRRLGDVAASHGVLICLEPNPRCYGANFMTTSAETAEVVRAVDHPAIRMQFDTGALAINDEDPQAVLSTCAGLVGHVHISEPNLVPIGDGNTDHAAMRAAMDSYLPGHVATIEMLSPKGEPALAAVARALRATTAHYGAAGR